MSCASWWACSRVNRITVRLLC